MMKRLIIDKLIKWQQNKQRKPLILNGARQVGKTHILHYFGENYYKNYHYINFEKDIILHNAFQNNLDPKSILTEISFYLQQSIDYDNDLIIFDEIQACPKALTSLKYFFEDMPNVQICSAGSLLGVILGSVSYPVGKVEHLNMYPMTFTEFLLAINDQPAVEYINNFSINNIDKINISELMHTKIWQYFKYYLITGGLPAVVKVFSEQQADLYSCMQQVREVQNNLITDYMADVAKHSGKTNAMHISRIWQAVPEQLAQTQDSAAKKFKFKNIVSGINRYSQLANAIDWLARSGLLINVPIVNSGHVPTKAYVKENFFKLFLFDVGILNALCELPVKTIIDYSYGSYKGFVAENFVAQALLSANNIKINKEKNKIYLPLYFAECITSFRPYEPIIF